ncbi:MAG: hypothetical protein Kilf2KO_17090 [Rhodospirillales bacterium]
MSELFSGNFENSGQSLALLEPFGACTVHTTPLPRRSGWPVTAQSLFPLFALKTSSNLDAHNQLKNLVVVPCRKAVRLYTLQATISEASLCMMKSIFYRKARLSGVGSTVTKAKSDRPSS